MKQFIERETEVEKYDVKVDELRLQELRLEIINNCSEIIHHDYLAIEGPKDFDFLQIRNLKQEKLKNNKYNAHHYTYDEYLFPYLVNIIDRILQEDDNVLDELLHPDYSKEDSIIIKKKKDIIMDLFVNDNISLSQKSKRLVEYKKLLDSEKLNVNRKDVQPYYQQVANCLTFVLESIMDKKQIDEVLNFLELKHKNETKTRILN